MSFFATGPDAFLDGASALAVMRVTFVFLVFFVATFCALPIKKVCYCKLSSTTIANWCAAVKHGIITIMFSFLLTMVSIGFILVTAFCATKLYRVIRKLRFRPVAYKGDLPTVSVCIPARNERHAMTACLEGVLASDYEKLEIIPADASEQSFDIMLDEMKGNKNRLKSILKQFGNEYDFVFIDCPPGFSSLSENIFNASDVVLMPIIPSTLSIRTYNMVKDYFKEKDLDIKKMMCFFTMTDLRKNMHNEIMEELYKDKRFFQNYIPYLSDVEKMGIHKAPIMEFANSSYAASCYRELWPEIKEGVLE